MNSSARMLLVVCVFFLLVGHAPAAPVIPGLAGKHPLTEPQVGQLLIGELRCTACHASKNTSALSERTAPDLSNAGSRISSQFLQRMIASPSQAHPGTTMPDLLASQPAEQRDAIAGAIAHFLVAQSKLAFKAEPIDPKEASAGQSLFHSVGCVACHSPRDEHGKELKPEGVVGLGHIPAKHSLSSLAEFLFQPTQVRPSGRMPDMKLTPGESRAIASYLLGNSDRAAQALQPQEKLVALGKKYFLQFNCAACHKLGDNIAAAPVGDLRALDATGGCLAGKPSKSPQFNLSEQQTRAIRSALAEKPEPQTDKTRLALMLTTFNCIACHVRDDYGGVPAENNPLFLTSEKELGDEARIPPPLTIVGAKLQPTALKKMLFDGDSTRPYMFTRMPQFGETNLRQLPELFAHLDHIKSHELALPSGESENKKERDREKELRAAGRTLLGDQGLNCIACHAFNGKAPSKKGIDLMTVFPRLKPDWFYEYMINPAAFRPRTVMPTSWPGGKAVHKGILNGDTDRQLEAIWYYLSLGTSAADPSGIRSVETILSVGDAARTYRGRSSVAGFRGIAVGFPEKLSYAFNAETGTLSAIWLGDFIRVDRSGQGSGGFRPAGPFLQLAQDVSFFRLTDERTPWPLRPVMTKEAPVNPDPLYPKNRGYQFKGYFLDDHEVPTFMYKSGDIDIEDRSTAEGKDKTLRLVRVLSLDSPREETLWFRALTGAMQEESKLQYRIPGLRLSVPQAQALIRPIATEKNASELLLKFEIPRGKSKLELTYEPLK